MCYNIIILILYNIFILHYNLKLLLKLITEFHPIFFYTTLVQLIMSLQIHQIFKHFYGVKNVFLIKIENI